MSEIRLGNVMIDCADAELLCGFYHRLLGWRVERKYGNPAVVSEGGVLILFSEEADYVSPVWPEEPGRQQKQMHLDFQVADVRSAVAYAETLGAVKAPTQYGGDAFVTMLDPAGHPFCLCSEANPD